MSASDGPAVLARGSALKSIVYGLSALPESYYHNQGMIADWDDIEGTTTGDLFDDPFIGAVPAPKQTDQPKIEVYHATPFTATQRTDSAGEGNNGGRLPPPLPPPLYGVQTESKPYFDQKESDNGFMHN